MTENEFHKKWNNKLIKIGFIKPRIYPEKGANFIFQGIIPKDARLWFLSEINYQYQQKIVVDGGNNIKMTLNDHDFSVYFEITGQLATSLGQGNTEICERQINKNFKECRVALLNKMYNDVILIEDISEEESYNKRIETYSTELIGKEISLTRDGEFENNFLIKSLEMDEEDFICVYLENEEETNFDDFSISEEDLELFIENKEVEFQYKKKDDKIEISFYEED